MSVHNQRLKELVHEWTDRFHFDPGYYSGMGPHSDLNAGTLEDIYQGLADDVSQEAADNFVLFVKNLSDLSPSAFIRAFQRFWQAGCKHPDTTQKDSDRYAITARRGARATQGFGAIASALTGDSKKTQKRRTESIKQQFLRRHQDQL